MSGVSKYISHRTQREGELNLKVRGGLTKAALLVEREAKMLAPVDTGTLKSSITHRVKGNEAEIGTVVKYASFQEYGPQGGGKTWEFTPFLGPAIEKNKDKILKLIAGG